MRRRAFIVLLGIASILPVSSRTVSAQAPARAPRQTIENLAAFARLYGVVRYFYPSDAAAALDWNRFAVHGVRKVREARDARELAATLKELVDPLGPGIEIGAELPNEPRETPAAATAAAPAATSAAKSVATSGAPPAATSAPAEPMTAWRYQGAAVSPPRPLMPGPYKAERGVVDPASVDTLSERRAEVTLAAGVKARVPIALTATQIGPDGSRTMRLNTLIAALGQLPDPGDPADLDVRLADVIVTWNVFRHFYPYWPEAGVDWDARLAPQLTATLDAAKTTTHRDMLRQIVSDARDGHGRVSDPKAPVLGWMPLQFAKVADGIAILASANPNVPVGAVVSSIDDAPAARRFAEQAALVSGTPQWKEYRALQDILRCTPGVDVRLVVDNGNGPRTANVTCEKTIPAAERRPEIIAQLEPGVWYVDLTRARMEQVRPSLATLAEARAVIFDLRGYPTDAGAQILPYLLEAPESDRWMHVARITGPFFQNDGWESYGWNMKPIAPRLAGKIVFMTDGRAISYAESVMGYVADRKLATIVGSPTAGTNGNVSSFTVPSGATVGFTGMRVTGHDGRAPYHLIGVSPNVPATRTLAGIREGRDEVLERALAVVNGK